MAEVRPAASDTAHAPAPGDTALAPGHTSPAADTQVGIAARIATWRLIISSRMPRWLPEVLLLCSLYALYEASRGLLGGRSSAAFTNGDDILTWETAWHLDLERPLNALLEHSTTLAVMSSYYYAALHYVVTPLVLIWVFRYRSRYYRLARTSLVASTVIGLIGFYVLPTAPPRLLPGSGFTDTLATTQHYGWWDTAGSVPRGMGHLVNQYAAMPSLHVGWALWVGVLVAILARRTWVRRIGVLYPAGTAFAVLATGNHYLLDIVAGALTMAVGTAIAVWIVRRWPSESEPSPDGLQQTGFVPDESREPAAVG